MPDLSIAINNKFGSRQCIESHRSPCVNLLSADSDLCTKAELESVCEPRGSIHIDRSRVDLLQKLLGMRIGICDASECFVL